MLKNSKINLLFKEIVRQHANKIAIDFKEQTITYKELDDTTDHIAAHIYTSMPDKYIGLLIPNSIELIIGIISIIKAGKAYVPLNVADPIERRNYIIEHSNINKILTSRSLSLSDNMRGAEAVNIEDLKYANIANVSKTTLPIEEEEKELYVIYTSGTTGKPKGVLVTEKNLLSLIDSVREHYDFSSRDIWPLCHNSAFDVSVWEIFSSLLTGAKLVIPTTEEIRSPAKLHEFLRNYNVTILNQTPGAFKGLVEYDIGSGYQLDRIRAIIFAGEKLNFSILTDWFKKYDEQAKIYNMYGITEGTVHCSIYEVTKAISIEESRSIVGKPLNNHNFLLLNQFFKPVIKGTRGELYTYGAGVAKGYLRNKDLTDQRFIKYELPNKQIVTLYKTGDILRELDNGDFEYLNRKDDQIKIRGYRVELGEIQNNLLNLPEIKDCAIKIWNQSIIAYVTLKDKALSLHIEEKLISSLKDIIPHYMLPQRIIIINSFKLTTNGKIDLRELQNPFEEESITKTDVIFQNQIEKEIANVWQRILDIKTITQESNFFALGGNSLLLMQLNISLDKLFGVQTSIKDLNHFTTLREQAAYVQRLPKYTMEEKEQEQITLYPQQVYEDFPLSELQLAYWLGSKDIYELGKVSAHTYFEYNIAELDTKRLTKAWNLLIKRHDALRVIIKNEEAQQVLSSVPIYDITEYKIGAKFNSIEARPHINQVREELSHQVFDYSIWPIFDIRVSSFLDTKILHLSFDAITLDAFSLKILFDEWNKLYHNLDFVLLPLDLSLRDYFINESRIRLTPRYNADKIYWLNRLNTLPSSPQLPTEKITKVLAQQKFSREYKTYPAAFRNKLKGLLQSQNLSETVFFATLFGSILSKWSNSNHFLINLTIFNRKPVHSDVNKILGDFSSILLLEIDFTETEHFSFFEKCNKIKDQLFTDLQHRSFSGIEVIRELNRLNKINSSSVNFPVVYTSVLGDDNADSFETSIFNNEYFSITQTPQLWLDFKTYLRNNELIIEWDYVEGLFPEGLIADMHSTFCNALEKFVDSPTFLNEGISIPEYQLDLIQQANNNFLSNKYNFLHQPFYEISQFDDTVAVIHDDITISYAKLKREIQALVNSLYKANISNEVIGIFLPKSIWQIISVFSILKSGNAFLPIDIDLPANRIKQIVTQSKIKNIVCLGSNSKILNKLCLEVNLIYLNVEPSTEVLDEDQGLNVDPTDIAYIIFTSGSTGIPKGVVIEHAAVSNTIEDMNKTFSVTKDDSILALSKLSFDLAIYDIFGLLGAGGKVVIPNIENIKSPQHWFELIQKYKITIWNTVPMFMQMFIEWLESNLLEKEKIYFPRLILLSGDWVPPDLPQRIRQFAPKETIIVSLGGATEASIWSIKYIIGDNNLSYIPYGKAMANQEMLVLNQDGRFSPIGTTGEIYIGGKGLARGYYLDPLKTFNSFRFNFDLNRKLYKTGDLGKLAKDGNIIFLGREDYQVKVNGYRVELGDIESALNNHHKISSSIVDFIKSKSLLVAYVIPKDSTEKNLQGGINLDYKKFAVKNEKKQFRYFSDTKEVIKLLNLDLSANDFKEFYYRKSYRNYLKDKIVEVSNLNEILRSIFSNMHTSNQDEFSILEKLNSIFNSFYYNEDSQRDFPKYKYASAGGLYPVQVYLRLLIPIDSLAAGVYYFRPDGHLIRISLIESNAKLEISGHELEIYFVANLDIINPFYAEYSKKYSFLEAGYMQGVLDIALNHQTQIYSLELSEHDYLQLELEQKHEILRKFYIGKRVGEYNDVIPDGLRVLINANSKWYNLSAYGNLNEISTTLLWKIKEVTGENSLLLKNSTIKIFFVGEDKPENYIKAGYLSHLLQHYSVDYQIGFCPIGEIEAEYKNIISKVSSGRFIHMLAGGYIEKEEINSKKDSEIEKVYQNIESELKDYLSIELPHYMVPERIIPVQNFPLTNNGKIDRKKLLIHSLEEAEISVSPKNWTEEELVQIVYELTNVNNVRINKNIFSYGLNSLLVLRLISRIRSAFKVELQIKEIFNNPTIEKLADILNSKKRKIQTIKEGKKDISNFPLTFAQKRLWFISKFSKNPYVFNIPLLIQIEGKLDQSVLKKAIKELSEKHAILKFKIRLTEEGLEQYIDTEEIKLSYQEINDIDSEALGSIYNRRDKYPIDVCHKFDLDNDALCKFTLYKIGPDNYIFLAIFHHIIMDGWSLNVFSQDLTMLYNKILEGEVSPKLTLPEIDYGEFALWHQELLETEELKQQEKVWSKLLQNLPAPLSFKLSQSRPKELSFYGKLMFFNYADQKLREFCKENNITLYVLLLTVFKVLLYHYSKSKDIIVGTPTANRHYQGIENTIGLFVNALPVRSKIEDNDSFLSLLEQIRKTLLIIQDNQDIPFNRIVTNLQLPQDLSYNPIFQTWFVLHNKPIKSPQFNKCVSRILEIDTLTSKFDLALIAEEGEGNIKFCWEYSTDLFTEEFIEMLTDQYIKLLSTLLRNPYILIKSCFQEE